MKKALTVPKLFRKHKLHMEYYAINTAMKPNTFRNKVAQLPHYKFSEEELRRIKKYLRTVATDMLNTANS